MKLNLTYLIYTALGVVVVVLVWVGVHMLLSHHDATTLAVMDTELSQAKASLVYVADLTRQNKADDATEKIISDCANVDRQRFDSLLDQLSKSISPAELSELQGLFYRCGRFYAERKAIMATRLGVEVTHYTTLVNLRNAISRQKHNVAAELEAWHHVADAEEQWSSYFNDLVTYQGKIISLLLSGKRTTSPEVVEVLADVKSTRQQMEVLGIQIQGYRDSLLKL